MPTDDKTAFIVSQIKQLEDGYCNPRKFNEAAELRQDLKSEGYTDDQIAAMLDE